MSRVKIKFPPTNPLYQCAIAVRISDINYGNHLGNDALLSILHESRVQMLQQWGFSELDSGGSSLIMADVMIAYRNEGFYGDLMKVEIFSTELTEKSFDLLYRVTTQRQNVTVVIAEAKTGMACFNYGVRRIASMPETLKQRLIGMEF